MSKIILTDVVSGYQTATVQNTNNAAIETELNDKVLYRDNPEGEANTMEQELDMNSNPITNLPLTPTNNAHAASKSYVDALLSGTEDAGSAQLRADLASDAAGDGASMVGIEDSAADFTATTVESALAELVTEGVALAGVQTITGDKTFSGTTVLSGSATLSGTSTLSGAAVLSGATVDVSNIMTNSGIVKWAKGADLTTADVVAGTLTVGADGNYFDFTGTDTIIAIATVGVGTVVKIHFDAIAALSYDATNLWLPSESSITTQVGDEAEFVEYATGDWRCVNYTRADGTPIGGIGVAQLGVSQYGGEYIHIREEQVSGTAGGDFTNGAWRTRTLNTEVTDTGNHCTLSANQFTLEVGTYRIKVRAPTGAVNQHVAKLYNVTDVVDEIFGGGGQKTTTGDANDATVQGQFTISATKVFEIQHRCLTTANTNGFGYAHSYGIEVYTEVELWKVD